MRHIWLFSDFIIESFNQFSLKHLNNISVFQKLYTRIDQMMRNLNNLHKIVNLNFTSSLYLKKI